MKFSIKINPEFYTKLVRRFFRKKQPADDRMEVHRMTSQEVESGSSVLDNQMAIWNRNLRCHGIGLDMQAYDYCLPHTVGMKELELVSLFQSLIDLAVRSIDESEFQYRRIVIRMGLLGNLSTGEEWYEIDVFDSGRQWDPEICRYAYEAVYKQLKRVRGSLLIGSHPQPRRGSTTKVAVRFDGKGKFEIMDEFPNPV